MRIEVDRGVAQRPGQLVGVIGPHPAGEVVGEVFGVIRGERRGVARGQHRGETGLRGLVGERGLGQGPGWLAIERRFPGSLFVGGVVGGFQRGAEGVEPDGLGLFPRGQRGLEALGVGEAPFVAVVPQFAPDNFDGAHNEAAGEVVEGGDDLGIGGIGLGERRVEIHAAANVGGLRAVFELFVAAQNQFGPRLPDAESA